MPTVAPELSVIVPTFNEAGNVARLVELLASALSDVRWEVIFVDDDSSDGTVDRVHMLARADARVRLIQRIGRRGLSSACMEGVLASTAPYVAIIDGDLQHDETRLPQMLEQLRGGNLDLAVGSRYVPGGGVEGWQSDRQSLSRFATWLAKKVGSAALNDPMSGFFMIRRDAFMAAVRNLSALGFKLLVGLSLFPARKGASERASEKDRATGERAIVSSTN